MTASRKQRAAWFFFATSANWFYVSAYLYWDGRPLGAASDLALTAFVLAVVIAGTWAFVPFAEEQAAHEREQRQAASQELQ